MPSPPPPRLRHRHRISHPGMFTWTRLANPSVLVYHVSIDPQPLMLKARRYNRRARSLCSCSNPDEGCAG
eukprot:6036457-Alexandrium_andersonii.AAC.1